MSLAGSRAVAEEPGLGGARTHGWRLLLLPVVAAVNAECCGADRAGGRAGVHGSMAAHRGCVQTARDRISGDFAAAARDTYAASGGGGRRRARTPR
ncbi:unnamed protein product [Lampetra planeri]